MKTTVSKRRLRELRRIERAADALLARLLVHDDKDPKIFEEDDRNALRRVLYTVAEAEFVFAKLNTLKDARRRGEVSEWLCDSICSRIEDYAIVKLVVESVCGQPGQRPGVIPTDLRTVARLHGIACEGMRDSRCDARRLLAHLLRAIQLELIWFALMW
ncbi:MAG: hypothetical protein IT348_13555 [Candidatus Eisenbacteria bacterium]|nr:hypothetical protein [Candidatus Eisenbacteria bacterium]